jgi:hypothetical protein
MKRRITLLVLFALLLLAAALALGANSTTKLAGWTWDSNAYTDDVSAAPVPIGPTGWKWTGGPRT